MELLSYAKVATYGLGPAAEVFTAYAWAPATGGHSHAGGSARVATIEALHALPRTASKDLIKCLIKGKSMKTG